MADTPTQLQEISYGFAPQIAPYAEQLLGSAAGSIFQYQTDPTTGQVATDASGMPIISGFQPYQQYQGERFAQFTPMQQQAFEGAATMTSAPQLQDATAMAGLAGLGALNTSYTYAPVMSQYTAPEAYKPTQFTAPGVSTRDLQQYQMAPAERVRTQSFARPGAAESFMSPYMQNVVNEQQQAAQREADIQKQTLGAQFAQAGAYGGGRFGVQQARMAEALARQKGDIQAQGLQQAYQQAQQQFNAEQQARLQAQMANQQAGLATGQQNLAALLGVQQFGAQQDIQAQLANQQAAMQAQQLAEQSQQYGYGQAAQANALGAQYGQAAAQLNAQQGQFGAGLGLQGLQTALQSAQGLGQLGQTAYTQEMGINALQNQYGTQQQQQIQNILGSQYQDFLNYQNYPYKQLGFMSDILRGVPLTQTGSSLYQAPPSTTSQLAGLGTAAIGASKLGLFAKGGSVKDTPAGLADLAIYNMGA